MMIMSMLMQNRGGGGTPKINKKKIKICPYLLDKWVKKDKKRVIFM
jgi:hypothetical protein